MRRSCLVVILLAVGAALAYFVWPTPWVYYTEQSQGLTFQMRWHQITHETEKLFGPEWQPLSPADVPDGPPTQNP